MLIFFFSFFLFFWIIMIAFEMRYGLPKKETLKCLRSIPPRVEEVKYLHVQSDWGVRVTNLLNDDGDAERTRAITKRIGSGTS